MDILDTLRPVDSFTRRDGCTVQRYAIGDDDASFYEPAYRHYVRILTPSAVPASTLPYPSESVAREAHEWHCWDRSHGRPVLQRRGR